MVSVWQLRNEFAYHRGDRAKREWKVDNTEECVFFVKLLQIFLKHLKDFQMVWAHQSWLEERSCWRSVVSHGSSIENGYGLNLD